MKYYLLIDDMWEESSSQRWVLGSFKGLTARANFEFVDPPVEYMEPCTYPIEVFRNGVETDFVNSMDPGNIPIVSERLKDAMSGLPEVDEPFRHVVIEPVEFENRTVSQRYFVLITETQLDCVDESKSEFQKYEDDDPVRPDKAGQYRVFTNLVVDPSRADGHHIFRLKKHLRSLIVSEEVKRRFEAIGATGAVFQSVNGDRQTVS